MIPTLIVAIALLLVVIGWYVFEGRGDRRLFRPESGRVIENLRPPAAQAFLEATPAAQVLDVRSGQEFAGGFLLGAVNISIADPDFADRVGRLDPARPVLVYCEGGYRSRKAVGHLREMGFASIHHLHRGFLSWRMAGLPVQSTDRPQP